jgi:hypothetical protein
MNTKLAQHMTSQGHWTPEAVDALLRELKDGFRGFNDHSHIEICAYPEVTVRRKFNGSPETIPLEQWDVYANSANFAYVKGIDVLFVHLPVRAA